MHQEVNDDETFTDDDNFVKVTVPSVIDRTQELNRRGDSFRVSPYKRRQCISAPCPRRAPFESEELPKQAKRRLHFLDH